MISKFQTLKSMGLGVLLASFPLCAISDDTDIYSSVDALEQLDINPNVLFVLDTSGSMRSNNVGNTGKSRMEVMKEVLTTFIDNTDIHGEINIGLAKYNNSTGSVIYPVSELTGTSSTTLNSILTNDMRGSGYTPFVPSFYESILYYLGLDVKDGLSRPPDGVGDRRYFRISHADTMENETYNIDDSTDATACAAASTLSDSACEDEYYTGTNGVAPKYTSPVTEQCQPNHIVLLTDGAANQSSGTIRTGIKTLIDPSDPSGVSCANYNSSKNCAVELARYLYENDLFDDSVKFPAETGEGKQNIVTHTIGFDFSDTWLKDISDAGRGKNYNAEDQDDLSAAFTEILDNVLNISATFSAPSATVNQFNRLSHRDDIYFAVFNPSTTQRWAGNVKKYKLESGGDAQSCSNGDNNVICDKNGNSAINASTGFFMATSQDYWSTTSPSPTTFDVREGGAANQLSGASARNIYSWFSAINEPDLTDSVNAITWDDQTATPVVNGNVTDAMLGSPANGSDLIDWANGLDVKNYDAATTYRKQLGAPLHSRPVITTYGGTENDPDLAMFYGTNEGYFHAIDAVTGEEFFSFMPEEMLPKLEDLYDDNTGEQVYGIDGAVTVWVNNETDTAIVSGDGDFVYAYFGMRRGGTSYYALDVTTLGFADGSHTASPKFLWRIKSGDAGFGELGETWSRPIKTKIRYQNGTDLSGDPTYALLDVLFFSGGYDNDQDDDGDTDIRRIDDIGRAIYMVDAKTGKLLWRKDYSDDNAMAYSIPANLTVIDTDGSGDADQIYVGDMGGRVWRFDINNGNPLTITGSSPYTGNSSFIDATIIADLADNTQDGARRFYQSPDIALIKGSGGLEIALTIGSGWRAKPNELEVHDRFYMMKVPAPYQALTSYVSGGGTISFPYDNNDLLDVTGDLTPSLGSSVGWRIDMEANGEKVLSTPLTVQGKIIFVTYEPKASTDVCSVTPGTSREYVLNLEDGAPAYPNDPDNLVKDDRFTLLESGTIVDEPVVIFTKDGGGSVFLGTEKGQLEIVADKAIRTYWYEKE